MPLDDFARACSSSCSGFWLRRPGELRRLVAANDPATPSMNAIFTRMKEHVADNQIGRAVNWLAAALVLNEPAALKRIKQEGLLRSSKYDFKPVVPLGLTVPLLEHADELGLQATTVEFLDSTKHLLGLARHAEREYQDLMAIVRAEPFTLAHSCLITIEFLFMTRLFSDIEFGLDWSIEPYTKEDLAEGFSFLWAQVYRQLGITRMTTGLWDAAGIHEGRYLGILRRAASLREFMQVEILVETFGYRCTTTAEAVEITAPRPELEKSIRLGFIDHQMRGARLVQEVRESDIPTLRSDGEKLHNLMRQRDWIQHLAGPPERVRFMFPVIPALVERLRGRRLFAEEIAGVVTVLDDFGLTSDASDQYQVADGLSLGDVQRLQRFAMMTAACVATELARRRDDPLLMVNSAVPVYQSDGLLDACLAVVLEPRAAQQFRTLFRWPPENTTDRASLDVQYRPLLEAEHEWRVPFSLLASSNLTRAALMLTGLRPGAEQAQIEDRIVEAFRNAGHPAVANTRLRDANRDLGEIDVAALVDDALLILECKNSLLPCNLFELRTSFRHCEDAAGQLDRLVSLLEDPRHRDTLLARLGVAGRPVARVVTGIAVSNRLFQGLRLGAHMVVPLGGFSRFVTDGDFYLNGELARSRPEGPLSAAALVDYFEGSFFTKMFDAMIPGTKTFRCGTRDMRLHTFLLNFIELGRQFGIEVRVPEPHEPEAPQEAVS